MKDPKAAGPFQVLHIQASAGQPPPEQVRMILRRDDDRRKTVAQSFFEIDADGHRERRVVLIGPDDVVAFLGLEQNRIHPHTAHFRARIICDASVPPRLEMRCHHSLFLTTVSSWRSTTSEIWLGWHAWMG
jgi:hypothetical protein